MKKLYKEHLNKVLNAFDKMLDKNAYEEVLLYSGEQKTIYLDDNSYPFKVHANFKYLVPVLNNPYSFLIYRSGEKPKLLLLQKIDFWDSQPKEVKGEWTEFFEISYYHSLETMRNVLPKNLSKSAYLGEETERFKDYGFKSLNDQKLIDFIHYQRIYKSEYEVQCLREANKIASIAHLAAKQAFLEGKSEIETHLSYLNAISYRENEVPYENIVAFDESAAILHYNAYKKERFTSKSFLLDAGASYRGYHADITRTFAKKEHGLFHELISAVNESTLNIISKIKIDMNYEVLQEQMHLDAAQILRDFNLMNISKEEIYEKEYTKLFSPAGVGHYIGLQVHDIGNTIKDEEGSLQKKSSKHKFLRLNKNIEEVNVFTIEPGIYIIEQLLKEHYGKKEFNWKNIEALRPFGGVRIEDSVYVSARKIENLTMPYLP